MPQLEPNEIAVILASLRFFQETLNRSSVPDAIEEIWKGGGKPFLMSEEIDRLCEMINFKGLAVNPAAVVAVRGGCVEQIFTDGGTVVVYDLDVEAMGEIALQQAVVSALRKAPKAAQTALK